MKMDDMQKKIEQLENQLNQQEKLVSLGLLTAGIVHEIQNPLNFVINFSKLSLKLLKDMEDVLAEVRTLCPEDSQEELQDIVSDLQGNLNKIEENGKRISNTVRGILLYSREKIESVPTNLSELTHEYIWLSYHAVRASNKNFNVSIQERYEDGLPLLNVIPQHISQAILNIMNNACHAVSTKAREASDPDYAPQIKVDIWKEEDRLKLVFEDNGVGIYGETKEQLFTPFYTTKPIGEGTGLGLSITKSIIDKHKGSIDLDTKVNEYTRFIITLPIS